MNEPTEEQLKILKKDIMSGRVMIVEVEHYKRLTDNLDESYDSNKMLQEQIKELEVILEYKNEAREQQGEECERRHNLLCEIKEVVDRYFEQTLKGGK